VATKQKIVIGVTGHRHVDRQDRKLKALIRNECRTLARTHAGNPFVILSGLAEGADRMVARIAMSELDAALIAVLPVPRESFVMDFGDAGSRREFTMLLNRSDHVITAPLLTKRAWKSYTPSRDRQYAWEGSFLARQSKILIAVWDGADSKGLGGTGDVVRWFKRGRTPTAYLHGSALRARSAALAPRRLSAKRRALLHIHPNAYDLEKYKF